MKSVPSPRLGIVPAFAIVLLFLPKPIAMGIGTLPDRFAAARDAQEQVVAGLEEIQTFFLERDFSLIEAWRLMRISGDPAFFDSTYPEISREIDQWAVRLEQRARAGMSSVGPDYTFVLDRFAARILDSTQPAVVRDNALATICMVCVMDDLRCRTGRLHALLAEIVADDPSLSRKAEALRWWRVTSGRIDEALMERLLRGPEGEDPVLRGEIARALFSMPTEGSLRAQQFLVGMPAGVEPESFEGQREQIACTAMRHLAGSGFAGATPRILAALEDPSAEVRACAVESLVRLTGNDFGFDPHSDRAANAAALGRWKAWWEERSSATRGVIR